MKPAALADARQRAAAAPGRSVFVTANAGSGKTKVLIDRIARLLLEGAPPASFLCITYTKAAAAEMQRRLYKQLGDWCVADDETLRAALSRLEGDARVAPDALLPKARALFARALESPGGLKIQTIHAFCERLLRRFPLEAGVAPGFDIADDPQAAQMLAQSWRDVAARADAQVEAALQRFAARLHDERFQDLLSKLVSARGAFRDFLAGFEGEAAARGALKARHGATRSAEEILRDAIFAAPWDRLRDAVSAMAEMDKTMADLRERCRAAIALKDGDAATAFEALKAIVFTGQGEPRARLVTKAADKDHPFLAPLFDGLQVSIVETDAALRAAERFADSAAALTLSIALDSAFEDAKHRAGVLDFADLISLAAGLLSAEAAPWVLYKLDGGLEHILIDEGQDTSPLQWSLVAPLQAEFFAGEGAHQRVRTMFAVGDPKQSIYSFQGAHPESFLKEAQALAQRAGSAYEGVSLDVSFRSTAEVLEAVDATFKEENLGAGRPGMFDVVEHLAARENERGRVEWWPATPRPERPADNAWDAPLDQERADSAEARLAAAIAANVRKWIDAGEAVWEKGATRPMVAGDVLVLVRSRGNLFRQILKALKRSGLPVAGADRMVLKDELASEDCLTLLRVAADPADDLSLACLLKSPWVGLMDDAADLYPLAAGRGKGETLMARLLASSDAKYAEAREFVGAVQARAATGPHALLAWALERHDAQGRSGWERLFARLGAESRDPIEEVLARALNAHQRGAATLDAFLAEIERDAADVKREMEEAGSAVRVMTVHGAKGLEAPVVLLPDTTAPPRTQHKDDLFFDATGPVFSASAKEDDSVSAAARAAADAQLKGEHLRLLYVAMTRARDRLIVCGIGRGQGEGKADDESWHTLVGRAMEKIGAPIETAFGPGFATGAIERAERRDAPRTDDVALPDWARRVSAPLETEISAAPSLLKGERAALSPRADGTKRFRRGLLLHGLLQRLPETPEAARADAAGKWLARQGVGADEAQALTREALAVVQDARFAHAFGPGSRAEAPIVGRVGALKVRGIVDRIVVREDAVEVLDFKSDRPSPEHPGDTPEGYVLQMALYRAVLRQVFPGRAVRCALIWTEKPVLVELSEAQMEGALAAQLEAVSAG